MPKFRVYWRVYPGPSGVAKEHTADYAADSAREQGGYLYLERFVVVPPMSGVGQATAINSGGITFAGQTVPTVRTEVVAIFAKDEWERVERLPEKSGGE